MVSPGDKRSEARSPASLLQHRASPRCPWMLRDRCFLPSSAGGVTPARPTRLHKAHISPDQTQNLTGPERSTRGLALQPTGRDAPPPEGARGDGGGPPRPLPSQLQLNAYGRKGWETTPKAPADPWMSRRPMDTARELVFLLWRHKQSCTQQHCLPHAHGSPPSRHPTRRSRRRSRGRARGLRRAPDYLVTQVPSPHCYGRAVKAQTG